MKESGWCLVYQEMLVSVPFVFFFKLHGCWALVLRHKLFMVDSIEHYCGLHEGTSAKSLSVEVCLVKGLLHTINVRKATS